MIDKPQADSGTEASWLEVDRAALYLEAARHYEPPEPGVTIDFGRELVATYLLTGGRKEEVLGLQVEDLSFDRSTDRFRPNQYRELKTSNAHRSVPLWPQLRDIFTPYLFGDRGPTSGPLFPSPRTGKKIHDIRSLLDNVAELVGWEQGAVRTKMLPTRIARRGSRPPTGGSRCPATRWPRRWGTAAPNWSSESTGTSERSATAPTW